MSQEATNNLWIGLQSLGDIWMSSFSNLVLLNENEFITALSTWSVEKENGAIHKYNVVKNEWIKWISYPQENCSTNHHSVCMNQDKTMIYIHNSERQVIKINIKTKQFDIIHVQQDGANGVSLCIDNKFHVFGGWNHAAHCKYDDDTQTMIEIHVFNEFDQMFYDSAVIWIERMKSVLIIGGMDAKRKRMDTIYLYTLSTHKMEKLCVTLPYGMYELVAVITKNERYVIIIGGNIKFSEDSMDTKYLQDIYVLDLYHMVMMKSSVCTPFESRTRAVIMSNDENRDLLVNGYLKQCLLNGLYLSQDLIGLISSFYSIEMVHVIQAKGRHFQINVDQILQSCDSM